MSGHTFIVADGVPDIHFQMTVNMTRQALSN